MSSISIQSSLLRQSILLIKSLNSGEVDGVFGNFTFPFKIQSITSCFVSPANGILLKTSQYKVIPKDQISDFGDDV